MKAVRPSNVGYFEMLAYATVRITLFNATKEGHRLFGGAPNQSMDFNLVLRFFLASNKLKQSNFGWCERKKIK